MTATLAWAAAVALVAGGFVALQQGQLLLGAVMIIAGILCSPGGASMPDRP